jgi:site-specific recombinase XerD
MKPYKQNSEHISLFLDAIENQKRYSEHTIRAYQADLNQLADHLGDEIKIIDLNKYDLHEYISLISKSITSKTLSRKIATIKSLFKYLVDENHIKSNISKSIKIPKISKKLPSHLTLDEMNSFFDKTLEVLDIPLRDLVVIDLLYSTGVRASECISILINDIDLGNNTIRISGKGGKERLVVFGDKTKDNLLSYIDKEITNHAGFLFPSKLKKKKAENNFITSRTIYNIVKKYVKFISNNEKLGPHSLRHSFATHLLQSGSDLMAIKDLLGHSSLGSTQIYTHLDTKRMQEIYKKAHPHAK